MALNDMTLFDPTFYAATNPDVVAKYGTDPDALLYHYLTQGKAEGRPPIAPVTPTPTPTPSWVNAKPAEHHEEEEDDDDDDSSSSNNNNNNNNNQGTSANFDSSTGVITPAISGLSAINWNTNTGAPILVLDNGSFHLPLSLTDTSAQGKNVSINSLSDLKDKLGVAQQFNNTIVDDQTGDSVRIDNITPVYEITRGGVTTQYNDFNDLNNAL